MIRDALTYPLRGPAGPKRILIGGGLSLFSVLLIPAFIIQGYLTQALLTAAKDTDMPPDFDWAHNFVTGVGVTIIAVIYLVIPLTAFILTTVGLHIPPRTANVFTITNILGTIGIISFALLCLPVAMALFLKDGFLAAWNLPRIASIITTKTYLIGILKAVLLFIPFLVVVIPLSLIPLLGALLNTFILFWYQLSATYIIGTSLGHELDFGTEPDSPSNSSTYATN